MSEHTPTPWTYRPHEFDDWGFIRGPDGRLAAVAKGHDGPGTFDRHRRAGTDPYAPNAAFIVKAVNSHDRLVAAAQQVLDGLNARIDHAASVVPVFDGIAELHSVLASIKERA